MEVKGQARVGEKERLEVERFEVAIAPEDFERFRADPDGYLTSTVRESGILARINSLRFRGSLDVAATDGGVKCYHVVHPEAEKSNTICF